MPVYDAERFKPPAPVATVLLCTHQAKTVADVPMLIDSGADLTLIPRRCVRELGLGTNRSTGSRRALTAALAPPGW